MRPLIYEYKDAVNFLHDTLKFKKMINPQYSIVAWSKQMGFSHHSPLDHIIQRRRKIKPNILNKIYKGLNLSEAEKEYFHELVLCQNATTPSEIEKHQAKIDKISEYYRGRILEEDSFKIISDWHNFAICSMITLKEFRYDPQWISSKLIGGITPEQVEESVSRLLRVGLLRWEADKLVPSSPSNYFRKEGRKPLEEYKNHQRQVLELATESMMDPNVNSLSESSMMTVNISKLKEVNQFIRDFRASFALRFEDQTGEGDSAYALTIQFFPILTSPC